MTTGCESCDMDTHPDASMLEAWVRLHRAVHALGAALMLEMEPVARGALSLITQGRIPVDEDKVARWHRIADQEIER